MNLEVLFRWLTKRLALSRFIFVICAAALAASAASAQDHVGNALRGKARMEILYRYDGAAGLPKPTQVVIQDFTKADSIVTDEAVSRHHRRPDSNAPSDETIQQLRDSFAKTFIKEVKKMHVEYDRVQDASTIVGPALIVQGEFTTIAPGNPRARIIIGFGRGASDLKTHVIISELVNGQKTVLLDCNIDSKSGKKPGAILSANVAGFVLGLATGHLGDKRSATVQADASRMAKLVGKQTKAIMVAQQWIAKPPK